MCQPPRPDRLGTFQCVERRSAAPDHQHPGRRRARRRLGRHGQQRPEPSRDRQRGHPAAGARRDRHARLRPQRVGPPPARRAQPHDRAGRPRHRQPVLHRRRPRGRGGRERRTAWPSSCATPTTGRPRRPPTSTCSPSSACRACSSPRPPSSPRASTRCASAACRSCWSTAGPRRRTSCSVAVDDVLGGRLAADHLLERGHRRIAFVGGDAGLPQVRERLAGVRRGRRATTTAP